MAAAAAMPEEVQLKKKFRELDSNRDGMLEMEEFARLLRQKGKHFEDREVRLLFESVDHDHTGRIAFDEFVDYIFGSRPQKVLTRKEQVAKDASEASKQMWQEVFQVEICGASYHQDLNDLFEQGELFNGRMTYDRGYPRCFLFYGWTAGRRKVGWFAARVKPAEGQPVVRFKMFNPSPNAMAPHLCSATWETPSGQRDKRMLCAAVDREIWDEGCEEGTCLPRELWEGDSEEDSDGGEWEGYEAGEGEEELWEAEWKEDVGEGVEDFEAAELDEQAYHCQAAEEEEAAEQAECAPFEDDAFPPGLSSLGAKPGPRQAELADGWTRVSQMHDRPCLFKSVVPEDVMGETSAPNRWFLCACAVVAEHPAWIQSMFGRTTSLAPDGAYTVRLYHPGKKAFMQVTIDDHVPTKGGAPVYAGITEEGEVWSALIEKAFAKLCSSYKNMQWGSTAYGLLYLCGGGGAESWGRSQAGKWKRSYTVWKGKALDTMDRKRAEGMLSDGVEITHDRLWLALREYMEYCYPVACSVDKAQEAECGLLAGWAYALLGAREVPVQGKALRMVRLRNPYGQCEWTGRWCDASRAWDACPAAVNALKFKPRQDGTFWMAYSDFVKYINCIDVVQKSMPVQGCRRAKIDGLKRALSKHAARW